MQLDTLNNIKNDQDGDSTFVNKIMHMVFDNKELVDLNLERAAMTKKVLALEKMNVIESNNIILSFIFHPVLESNLYQMFLFFFIVNSSQSLKNII